MTGASVTALVDRLESVGHLTREADLTDRRRVVLKVGTRAQRLAGSTSAAFQQRIDGATQGFTAADLDAVKRYLKAAIDAVEQHMATDGD